MKVTKEKEENRQAYLTIEMEPAEIETSLEKSYRRLVQRVAVPGFRKGKAPRPILERYIGRESLVEDTVKHLVPEAYEKALGEQNIRPIADPEIEVVQTEPLIFKATVPLIPEVTLGDYNELKLKPEAVTVTDDEIDKVIEQLRHQHATWEPVERASDANDMVTLDLESKLEDKPFINQKGVQYQIVKDSTAPVKGFAEQLIGLKPGEEKEFELDIPAEYPRPDMAGKKSWFKVRTTEVKLEKLPEVNDEFAHQVDQELKDIAALRERVTRELKQRKEARVQAEFEEKMLDEMVKLGKVEYPPVLIESEVHRILDQQARRLQSGGLSMEDYLKSVKKTEEELHEETHPVAEQRIVRSLILEKVAVQEKIEVSEAEIDADIGGMAQGAAGRKEEIERALNSPQARESIRQMILTRKTLQKLSEIVQGPKEEKEETPKEGEAHD